MFFACIDIYIYVSLHANKHLGMFVGKPIAYCYSNNKPFQDRYLGRIIADFHAGSSQQVLFETKKSR